MGMAASQARLLTITARLHDVEYKAQSIQNAKIQLATQSDQVYQDYLEALDATTLTVKDYNGNIITANFNTLCGRNAVDTGYKYALRSSDNRLIVDDDIKEAYDNFMKTGYDDPYMFAMYAVNGNFGNSINLETIKQAEEAVYEENMNNGSDADDKMVEIERQMNSLTQDGKLDYSNMTEEQQKEYDELEEAFRNLLYTSYADQIYYKNSERSLDDFDKEGFNYYVNIFKQIQQAGGCVAISDYGDDAANNSDWLQNMIQCGKITMDIVNTDDDGNVTFKTTSPSSDTYVSYTTTTEIDKTALAKAEAEYEHKTKEIDQKDKKYDMDLSKLETERTALTTEYESVKKVINDNIERTFGIFS